MTKKTIAESGMAFGPFPDGHFFYIEESNTYRNIQQGVQMAEFLLLRIEAENSPVLWVVEAKSSTPRPETQPNFNDFIAEIREKLINAFSLGWSACLNRHPVARAELPGPFRELDLAQVGVRFVLVINGHQEAWLPPVQEALKKALHSTVKTWNFAPASVAVLNEELARKYELVCATGQPGKRNQMKGTYLSRKETTN